MNESTRLQQRAEALFHDIVAAPEDRQAALLESRCDGDAALLLELRSLLDASRAEMSLRSLGSRRAVETRERADAAIRERLIGPYRLDRLLGRGGMGAVYLAHRADGQFQQQVAIKLIDLPLATEGFRERFRLERQILAGLVHPYIARLLDGGVGEDGDLYLAMEYVDGTSIANYCRQNRLPLRDRLILFKKVCAAVQFAHQNLVVHRDLKPDNILVATDGTPRLLDFGTAKLLATLPADTPSEFTRRGLHSFTPQYASPEQVLGETITTASDTYSLGVLLHVLVADVPPYELKAFTTGEMLEVICTVQPPRPSVVARSAEPPDADLDAIVLKALRKEPQERYLTVDRFAADIQAWLDGRPVMARRGTLRYRAGKFIRRNRIYVMAAALLSASVLAGLTGVLWQSEVAGRERQRALARAEDLRQLSNSLLSEIDETVKQLPGSGPVQQQLVKHVLEHLDRLSKDAAGDRSTQFDLVDAYTRLGNLQGNPYDQNIGDPASALVSLDKAIAIAQSLAAESLAAGDPGDSRLLGLLAGCRTEKIVARVWPAARKTWAIEENIGLYLTRAPVFCAQQAEAAVDLVQSDGLLALARQSRSEVLFGLGRTRESIIDMRAAVEAFAARSALPAATASQIAETASAYGALGDQLGQIGVASLGDGAGALSAYRKSLELSQRALAVDPDFIRSRRAIAIALLKIGKIEANTDPASAIDEYRRSLAAWDALPAAEKTSTATRRVFANTDYSLGLALTDVRDYPPAIAALERARSANEFDAAADAKDMRAQYDLAVDLGSEALTYVDMLDPDLNPPTPDRQTDTRSAIDLFERSIAIWKQLVGTDPGNRSWVANLAYEQVIAGTLGQVSDNGRMRATASAIASLRENAAAADASIDVLDLTVSALLAARPQGLQERDATVRYAERLVALGHRKNPNQLLSLAQAYSADGQLEKARAVAQEGLALLPAPSPGSAIVRSRKLLGIEVQRR